MLNEVKYVITKGDGSGEGWAGMGSGRGGGERRGREEKRRREGRGGQVLLGVTKGTVFSRFNA